MSTTIESKKIAEPAHEIHSLFKERWSPYAFSRKSVPSEDLKACFEAARWAPSSYNEQPWRYLTATSEQKKLHAALVECLAEPNRPWAKRAPVLAIGLYKSTFTKNGKDNKAAPHDLGIAGAFLTVEATRRGLYVHQMIGILPDVVKEKFSIPEDVVPYTGLAIGYRGTDADLAELPDNYADRDKGERSRKSLDEFVFGSDFGSSADL